MTIQLASNLLVHSNLNGAIEDVTPMISGPTCMRVRRFLEDPNFPALDYYNGHQVDALEYLKGTIYFLDACLLINRIDKLVVIDAMDDLQNQETKPVQTYRMYAPVLRRIIDRKSVNSASAREVLRSLYLEQTRPDAELDNPDWVDGYTGEKFEEDPFELGKACDKFLGGVSDAGNLQDIQASNNAAADLGWDEATRNQFVKAQTGFDSEDDIFEEPSDDRGYVPPTLLSSEWVVDPNIWGYSNILKEFNTQRRIVFEIMKNNKVPAEFWQEEFAKRIAVDAKEFAYAVSDLTEEFDAASIVAFVYPILGEFGISPEHLAGIMVRMNSGEIVELTRAIEEIGEDLPINDSLKRIGETDPRSIDPNFLEDLSRTFDKSSRNPIDTPEFNIAKINATMAGATLENANKLAWEAWKSRKSHIKLIAGNKSGLILDSEREISWKVAQIKMTAGEIEISADEKARLSKKLSELKISNDFTGQLAK